MNCIESGSSTNWLEEAKKWVSLCSLPMAAGSTDT
jgi:hypothetical protein